MLTTHSAKRSCRSARAIVLAAFVITGNFFSSAVASPQTLDFNRNDALMFVGGVATSFLIHESGHLLANLVLGNTPRIRPVKFMKLVPFFTISPKAYCVRRQCLRDDGSRFRPGPEGLYFIVSAGIHLQHISNDLLLSFEPDLRFKNAPFRKGMLAFNLITSFGYSLANWLTIEPSAGDLSAMDKIVPYHRGLVAFTVFFAAVFDLARYYNPDNPWIPWISRGTKGFLLGFNFTL